MSEEKLAVRKDKDRPKVEEIFNAFRNRQHLFIKAELPKSEQNYPWALKSWNTYEIKIISIELLPDSKNRIPDKGDYCYNYKLTGQLIGVNEKGVHPAHFAWDADGLREAIYLLFFTSNWMQLVYRTWVHL